MYMSIYIFFFFKQKTAYEMRISDWSSDVCSSDLGFRIVDQLGIIGLADPADARRRAALDLVEQARAVARLEEAVGATSEQEQLFERVERLVDAAGRREGAVIIALRPPRAAMLLDAGVSVNGAQQEEGEACVVVTQPVGIGRESGRERGGP